ncbi:hypothetical protein N7499_010014 [Penicillium canescens]|uniref:Uncharacterized protein n=1 Tax=Penicillium canescens TaxID=5083 RepID=A0AAD6IMI1_PENCN|nr:uncharacterized protein N7446_007968 [Penicillium canescens]KAJ6018805.1 hypothetical protein N7522_000872 [Penicillium canescens]KAJ6033738.1 hypothetical protein N7444_011509 [Penicillium canescens]KAJ6057068.1 hypothetical protein N7460_000342 [Penicillium canescens]KAJ6058385.1 hypothetical protein N7446_007968 [Penicillium canescens]KAJ6072000.1 hypothetical protein N7499_010014 [Penicillium canescens]
MYDLALGALTLFALVYYLVVPVTTYFYDPKDLRKFPNAYVLSGISDLPFLYEANKGFRSRTRFEAHTKHPDIYGHGTGCIIDRFYSETSGSHSHLVDVVDKQDHFRKRKILSSAYALKNLENWGFKVVETMLFTAAAIASIRLSEDLGFLDEGSDKVKSEKKDRTVKEVSFRECHAATGRVSYQLVWAYDWLKTFSRVSKMVSSNYYRMWKLDGDWNGIIYNCATTRLKRYLVGETLDDFFGTIM